MVDADGKDHRVALDLSREGPTRRYHQVTEVRYAGLLELWTSQVPACKTPGNPGLLDGDVEALPVGVRELPAQDL